MAATPLTDVPNVFPVDTNELPTIGILSQQISDDLKADSRLDGYDSYMMAAYVTFMESAGARVVPLILGEPLENTMDKLSKIDGVLFPGGSGDYYEFGKPIWDEILRQNDAGNVFPAWGTCLGFETMGQWAADEPFDLWGKFSAHSISQTIEFTVDPASTRMFGQMGESAYLFETYPMLLESHDNGIPVEKFETDKGFGDMFKLTSVVYEPEGEHKMQTATMESEKYPLFGTQFHPEKTMTMFNGEGVNHSWASVMMNRKFADYFVSLARENKNSFGDFSEG
jgi:gamma-glutamyl hydrolase